MMRQLVGSGQGSSVSGECEQSESCSYPGLERKRTSQTERKRKGKAGLESIGEDRGAEENGRSFKTGEEGQAGPHAQMEPGRGKRAPSRCCRRPPH